eukprot:s708_g17.t1
MARSSLTRRLYTASTVNKKARLDLDGLAPYAGHEADGSLPYPTEGNIRAVYDARAKEDKKQPHVIMWEGRPYSMTNTMIQTTIKLEKIMAFIVEKGVSPDEIWSCLRKESPDRRTQMRQIITNFLRRSIKAAFPDAKTYTYSRDAVAVEIHA